MKAEKITAIVWDVDGLLIDTESCDAQAWREEFARADVPISMEQYAAWWNDWSWHRQTQMIQRLAQLADIDQDAVLARRLARYTDLCAELPVRPGMQGWLDEAQTLDVQLAVATNDATGRARDHLDRLGLTEHFSTIVTVGDGIRRKPHPDLYLQAAAALGVSARECVALEDAPHGAAAAQKAGYAGVVLVANSVTAGLPLPADSTPPLVICGDPETTSLASVLASLPDRES